MKINEICNTNRPFYPDVTIFSLLSFPDLCLWGASQCLFGGEEQYFDAVALLHYTDIIHTFRP